MIKRSFDIVVASAAIIALSPLILVVSLFLLFAVGRPILFSQVRPGWRGVPFRLIKFRTMTDETDQQGKLLPDEERMTAIGRFLRNSSADELPELWNIIRGDMSLVGPRPLLMQYLPLYNDFQNRRHEVRPGLTGWAQVNGRNNITWEDKFRLDVWYVDNRSMWLDLKILALTVTKTLRRDGIAKDGHATTDYFEGNR